MIETIRSKSPGTVIVLGYFNSRLRVFGTRTRERWSVLYERFDEEGIRVSSSNFIIDFGFWELILVIKQVKSFVGDKISSKNSKMNSLSQSKSYPIISISVSADVTISLR